MPQTARPGGAVFLDKFRLDKLYVCLLSCRLGFNSELGQTNDFKIGIHSFFCLTLSINGIVWRTSGQVYLLCRWERHSAVFPHLGVVDRWPATPKRARIAH